MRRRRNGGSSARKIRRDQPSCCADDARPSCGSGMLAGMRVAIFTDNDFEKVNGVTTTLRAVLTYAPPDIDVRVYTASDRALDDPALPLASRRRHADPVLRRDAGVPAEGVGAAARRRRAARVSVIHLTTPGPVGLAAMRIARQLGLPDGRQLPHRSRRLHAVAQRVGAPRRGDVRVPALALWALRPRARSLGGDPSAADANAGRGRPHRRLEARGRQPYLRARAPAGRICAIPGVSRSSVPPCSTWDASRRKRDCTCCRAWRRR